MTDGTAAYWLDASGAPDRSALMAWQPGEGTPRRVAGGVPFGRLSVDGGPAWVSADEASTPGLRRIDLETGGVRKIPLPAGASRAVVQRGRVAFIRRPQQADDGSSPAEVIVSDALAPEKTAQVRYTDKDVYTINWGIGGSLVVSSNSGYRTVTDGRQASLDLDLLSGVHNDGGVVAFVAERPEGQVVVVGR